MLAQTNTFPSNGPVGIGVSSSPENALEIRSHNDINYDPTLLLTSGSIPFGASQTDGSVKAFFSLLNDRGNNNNNFGRFGLIPTPPQTTPIAQNYDVLLQAGANTSNMLFLISNPEGSDNSFKFFTHTKVERMRLTKDGFLGIGATTPRDQIHVSSGNGPSAMNCLYGAGGPMINMYYDLNMYKNFNGALASMQCAADANGVAFIVDRSITDGSPIIWNRSGYIFSGLRLNSNGNVGISEWNPQARLDITSQVRANANTRETALRIRNSAGTETFLVADDGYVLCSELKVAVPSSGDWTWADYVFNKEYKLLPLADVETYIKVHGHLPGIPSAKEVEENKGIEVAKIQAKLLEKIEELTLHVIRLQKELDETKSQLNLPQSKGK